jgi:CheY-like chemotaxis protein
MGKKRFFRPYGLGNIVRTSGVAWPVGNLFGEKHMRPETQSERDIQNGKRIRLRRRLESGRSRNILVVDDDESVRELMAMVLESDGYTVLRARHPMEALHFNREFPGCIDLLVTDFSMKPFQNGFELAHQVRTTRPDIRVVYVSGFVEHNVLQEELDTSTALFLPKPFTPFALLDRVEKALSLPAAA